IIIIFKDKSYKLLGVTGDENMESFKEWIENGEVQGYSEPDGTKGELDKKSITSIHFWTENEWDESIAYLDKDYKEEVDMHVQTNN
ncbi:hypothetical protein, partial [Pseudomonas sp. 2995-1]|uniref:hypothetical protein n=1 Tax=Pseudomonas sp. 2995-1 TaxID=1712679 RepID=UPI000C5106FB